MTNLVPFFPAVEALLRLRTLVHLVPFLPAPPALLGLRAVSGHVALLDSIIKIISSVGRQKLSNLLTVPALHRLRAVGGHVALLQTREWD